MERFAVIGLGRFGSRLAELLSMGGAEVLAVDKERPLVEEVRDRVTLAICMDSTDEEAIRAQGIDKVDAAIVGIGDNFEAAVLTTVILKQLEVPRIIVRATTDVRAAILRRIGADDIVNPENESAERWQSKLAAPGLIDRRELAEGFSQVQIAAPESFVGKTLEQLELRKKYRVNITAIKRQTEETGSKGAKKTRDTFLSVPMPDVVIQSGDVLFIMGADDAIAALPAE
ncbi:MAG: TrkA family potassium uptake protein [Planctomycetes bacterium]|nr:TrkA family potassium uptake protein [Planctomycetota bacterium]